MVISKSIHVAVNVIISCFFMVNIPLFICATSRNAIFFGGGVLFKAISVAYGYSQGKGQIGAAAAAAGLGQGHSNAESKLHL